MKIKALFVDFDNTICLHRYTINYASSSVFSNNEDALKSWFKDSIANKRLKTALETAKAKGCKLIMLTSAGSKQLAVKKLWMKKNGFYELFEDFYSISADMTKLQFAYTYRKNYGLEYDECALIDDDPILWNEGYRRRVCDTFVSDMFIHEMRKEKG